MATTTRIGGTNVTTALSARWAASMLAALAASQIGGLAMLAFWIALYALAFHAPAAPLQVIAAFAYGMQPLSVLAYVWATAALLGTCAMWGVVYSLFATALRVDKSRWAPLVLGLIVGLLAHLVGVNLLTPQLMRAMYGHNYWLENMAPAVSWAGYILFGLGFAAFPPIFRSLWLRFAGRRDLLAHDPRIQ
jgi:hypothetical protein